MRDAEGTIIYVGKAVNLKNRVRSYFQSSRGHGAKVRAMVARIADFDIMLCQTNLEALMLESNLIKLHRPYYNILLKDDKQYPFVRIDLAQPFPRVELVRRTQQDGAKYFGPYIGATTVREVLDLLRQIFPLRTCTLRLPDDKMHRPCIQYEIGNCLAPCAQKCTPEEYHRVVQRVIAFLNGHNDSVI
ncbi:MAG TPA: GIY-YIG nuclease family protein, partial [Clostridia bacterium]|nr:GIY-YIG nuclease family protein [Clostridia bacterium]